MRRASYREGVAWIALNDEPEDFDIESVSGYVSTLLLAALFGKSEYEVAAAIVLYRERNS
jgi:hypothetical protein